jgi:nitrate/TMAO reductase-like tetraheme cytochrome c subunit
MIMKPFPCLLAIVLIGNMMMVGAANAESRSYSATNPTWKSECASCHMAYPPQLLPGSSWRKLMSNLDKHFGTDASLDPKAVVEISAFLEKNAARETGASSKPVLRITETRWFMHEHDEVPNSVWRSAKVKSPSNCMACHQGADKGDFSEDNVRIPR